MAVDDGLAGAGSGLLVVVVVATLWAVVGSRRRRELWHLVHRHERRIEHRAIVVLVAMLITIASIFGPARMRPAEVPPTEWRPLAQLLPEIPLDKQLQGVEVASGFSTTGGVGVIRTAVETYQRSTRFYGQLKDRVGGRRRRDPSARRRPDGRDPGQRPARQHRHRRLRGRGGEGGRREDPDRRRGRHLVGPVLGGVQHQLAAPALQGLQGGRGRGQPRRRWARRGRHAQERLHGARQQACRGRGHPLPRRQRSDQDRPGSADQPGDETTAEQSKRLADIACEQPEDKRISTFVVHDRRRSPTPPPGAARPCCCRVICTGRSGPRRKVVDGRPVTTYTNGTTGGAAYAFALGYTLRRPGEVTLITYSKGQPIGLQTVTAELTGDDHGRRLHPLAFLTIQASSPGCHHLLTVQ